jgi:hypothetical protein
MSIDSFNRRLDRLDARTPAEPRRVILLVRDEGETQADAIARWCVENPGAPPPDDRTDFIFLTSIVSPNAQSPR